MSVDIDSLIIGCHIRVNGKRAKVISVESTGIVGCRADDDWLKVTSDDIEPIPLTHELLDELGFEEQWWNDDWSYIRPLQGKGFAVIRRDVYEWVVSFYPNAERCMGQMVDVRYLHIAEGLYSFYNTTMVEE